MSFVSAGVGGQRATVGFVERRHKEQIQEREVVKPGGAAVEAEGGGAARSHNGAERAAALLRAQRSLSPEGHRSASLPPPAQRNMPTTTPRMYTPSFHTHLTSKSLLLLLCECI